MPENEKVDDSGVAVLIQIPDPHPAKELFEQYDISFEQIGRRILKSPDEVKNILNGKSKPLKWVEQRIQTLMKEVALTMVKKKSG